MLGITVKIAIIGNAGSGKSTLAQSVSRHGSVAVLDLDTVYWQLGTPIERPGPERIADVKRFCREHVSWVIEGCYSDLIGASFSWNPELIFLDPGREACISNCRRRPLEPHKYRTKAAQDENLEFLIRWVGGYYERTDSMSLAAHVALFEAYSGTKRRIVEQPPPNQFPEPPLRAVH